MVSYLSLSLSYNITILFIKLVANYRKLEEDHSKAQNDKSVLERRLRESEDRCQELQDKNALQKQDFDGLAREKGEIEVRFLHTNAISIILSENWLQ